MEKQPTITGKIWINSEPLSQTDLLGRVVFITFWTYTSVYCLRTIPHLNRWWEEYGDKGLVVIGIHAPEFDFEKEPENVRSAVEELGIDWPVVLDNEYANWKNFENRYWPTRHLVSRKGNIVYTHYGEGQYEETEQVMQRLLLDRKGIEPLPKIESRDHVHARSCIKPTPGLYCGYLRGSLDNEAGFVRDHVASYDAPEAISEDSIALEGNFLSKPEFIESEEIGATLFLNFKATEVNLILRPVAGKAIIEVSLDGQPLADNTRGADVVAGSEVRIVESRLYNVLKTGEPVSGTLALKAKKGSFQAYAFTFSGCVEPARNV